MTGRPRWGDSWDLVIRAWCWSLVTVPAVAALGMAGALVADGIDPGFGGLTLGDAASSAGWFVLTLAFLDIVAVIVGFACALIALPFTHLLELATRTTVGPRVRGVLQASLAGVLAVVTALVVDAIVLGADRTSIAEAAITAGEGILTLAFLDIVVVIVGFGCALIALPFTHLLELATRNTVGPRVRAVLHASLAGVLACVPAAFGTEGFALAWLAPLALAAGTAAALAVRGAERRHRIDGLEARLGPAADGTTRRWEIPTGPAPSLQSGELP